LGDRLADEVVDDACADNDGPRCHGRLRHRLRDQATMVARKHTGKRITEQCIRPFALDSAVMRHPECGVGDVSMRGAAMGYRMPFVRHYK
jgi:hypothetical protein